MHKIMWCRKCGSFEDHKYVGVQQIGWETAHKGLFAFLTEHIKFARTFACSSCGHVHDVSSEDVVSSGVTAV